MMSLTKLVPNLRNAQVRNDLARPYDLHRRLAAVFPAPDGTDYRLHHQVLHRVEPPSAQNPYPHILVQAASLPDWSQLPEGYALQVFQKEINLPAFEAGQQWQYRLVASPTRSVKREGHRHSKRVPLSNRVQADADQEALSPVADWLVRKAAQHGFRLLFMHTTPLTIGQAGRAADPKQELVLSGVAFEGQLEITRPDLFTDALQRGIGPGKAFGFGLMSIAKPPVY